MRSLPLSMVLCVSFSFAGATFFGLVGCGTPATPAAPISVASSTLAPNAGTPWPAPIALVADAKQTLESGTSFVALAGWSLAIRGEGALLIGPEGDLNVGIVDNGASNADDAVKAGWALVHPKFSRPVELAQKRPGRRGWDETRYHTYETSPNEKLYLVARAYRKGSRWMAVVIEASQGAIERRNAQVRRTLETLQPAGYVRESFAGRVANPLDAARIKTILDAAERARALAGIPGEGIALVQGGKIVFEGGLGIRALGKPEKVDAHTEFMIASNTKALTTLLLAKLVDEKKLAWDTPVTELYPSFALGDAETTKKVQVSHLICACTGIPRQDLEWLFLYRSMTPKSSLALLSTMQPTTKFGETFQYSNLLAAAAGYVGGYVLYSKKELGAAYDDAMKSRVFSPLEMSETTFEWDRAMKANHATGHALDVDGHPAFAVMELNRAVLPHRPAGGAWSTSHDLAKYVAMELSRGLLPNGKRYIGEEALLARRKPQVAVSEYTKYGMGLFIANEYGIDVVSHGGDLFGYHSDMFWIPEANVGGVLLGNGDAYLVRKAFIRKVLEVLYDGHAEADEDAESAIADSNEGRAHERKRLTIPADAATTGKLAAHYVSDALGELAVATDEKGTMFDFGGWKSLVASRKNDDGTVSLITYAAGGAEVEFVLAERAGKPALVVRDAQHEYVYLEKAAK